MAAANGVTSSRRDRCRSGKAAAKKPGPPPPGLRVLPGRLFASDPRREQVAFMTHFLSRRAGGRMGRDFFLGVPMTARVFFLAVIFFAIVGCTDIRWPGIHPPPMVFSEDDPHWDPVTNPVFGARPLDDGEKPIRVEVSGTKELRGALNEIDGEEFLRRWKEYGNAVPIGELRELVERAEKAVDRAEKLVGRAEAIAGRAE